MFRAILPDGDLDCPRYEHTDNGVELYAEDDEFFAFVPYENLIAIINEDIELPEERSIW